MSYDIARMGLQVHSPGQEGVLGPDRQENLELGSYATKDYNWTR